MKTLPTRLFASLLLFRLTAIAQYCTLSGETPYSPLQPGITNFKLNTINRTSGNSESTTAVLVNTGLSTTVIPGNTYTISISHSEDSQFFPGARNNLRVWIDYNKNFSFTDAGETVLSKDLEAPVTTYTATFTIPSAAQPGTLTLRATAKMSADAGHTIPTPCNVPADPLGYHGEMEDYLLVIESSVQGQAPEAAFTTNAATLCTTATLTTSNASTGTPTPTYSWSATPAAGVTFSPGAGAANPSIKFTTAGVYSIICAATNSLGTDLAGKSVTVSACSTADLNETNTKEISIFPNPAADLLHVSWDGDGFKEIAVMNALGQKQHVTKIQQDHHNARIDLGRLQPGIYFLCISGGNSGSVKRFVVSR